MELLIVALIVIVAIILGLLEVFVEMNIYTHSKFRKKIDQYFFSTMCIS